MVRKSYRAIGVAIALLLLHPSTLAQSSEREGATLTIRFEGITESQGQVMLALYDREDSYSSRGASPLRGLAVPATSPATIVEITGLPPGRYAVRAFLDSDGNGQLTRNLFGIPVEPFAFSNNAHATEGPPSWADAAFEVSAPTASHVISFH